MLLYWGTLSTSTNTNVVAVRFASPVQISSVSIFPTGASIFAQDLDIVADTNPSQFSLNVFFNIQSVPDPDATSKPKQSNALLTASLIYIGGQRQFPIDWNPQFMTRLMILHGSFVSVTIAVYGELVSETTTPSTNYSPSTIQDLEPLKLPPVLDPADSYDPTRMARQLLALSLSPVPLTLAIRLVFCIKPRKDDWRNPKFPILSDLKVMPHNTDELSQILSKPLVDAPSESDVKLFCQSLNRLFASKALDIASLAPTLSLLACQHFDFVAEVMKNLVLPPIDDAGSLFDEGILYWLCDAATHPQIAKAFMSNGVFVKALHRASNSEDATPQVLSAIETLQLRIRAHEYFDRILADGQCQHDCGTWLNDIVSSERALGVWLLSMLEHNSRSIALGESPTSANMISRGFQCPWAAKPTNRDEFLKSIKALMGVASVLAVFAWADSIQDSNSVVKTLGILRVWQEVDGYREVVNHFITLTQFTVRLERLLESANPPNQCIIFAEQLLSSLVADDPRSLLNTDVTYTIRSLPEISVSFPETRRQEIIGLAELADGGVDAAVLTLLSWDGGSSRLLLVALMVLQEELKSSDDGEDAIIRRLWSFGRVGVKRIVPRLVAVLDILTEDFRNMSDRGNTITSLGTRGIMDHFTVYLIILDLTRRFLSSLFFSVTDIKDVVHSLCTIIHIINMEFVQALSCDYRVNGLLSALSAGCILVLETLCCSTPPDHNMRLSCVVVIEALAEEVCSEPEGVSAMDPATYTSQAIALLPHAIPSLNSFEQVDGKYGRPETFITFILPSISRLWKSMSLQHKVVLASRLADLDGSDIGVGDFLLHRELGILSGALENLDRYSPPGLVALLQHQIDSCCDFVFQFSEVYSPIWLNSQNSSDAFENKQILISCLCKLCELQYSSVRLGQAASAFLKDTRLQSIDMQRLLTRLLVLACYSDYAFISLAAEHLLLLPADENGDKELASDINVLFRSLASLLKGHINGESENTIAAALKLAQWMASRSQPVTSLDEESFRMLLIAVEKRLPMEESDIIDRITFSHDDNDAMSHTTFNFVHKFSLTDLKALFIPSQTIPSTPTNTSFTYAQDSIIATISPNSAVLRSPLSSLAKTYTGDSFRHRRQESFRNNASRLPSLHVDAFEAGPSSPTPATNHQSPMSPPILAPGFSPTMTPMIVQPMSHNPDIFHMPFAL